MSEMRETHRVRDRIGKGLDWISAADFKLENSCNLHGMRPEEKVTLHVLLKQSPRLDSCHSGGFQHRLGKVWALETRQTHLLRRQLSVSI